MTDFRALCAELADELTQFNAWYIEDNGYGLPALEALLRRSDAALAQSDEPAVPEGREPGSVAERPTVMQFIELSDEIEAAGLGQVDFARAVLARWGRPAPPADVSQLLDGYHTFADLYEHRHSLMLALMRAQPHICWFSRCHADGELPFGSDDWFIVGAELPDAPITYHLPAALYSLAQKTGAIELLAGRPWDGHTAADVVQRLRDWAITPPPPADGEVAELVLRVQRLEAMRETEKAALLDAFKQIDDLKHRIDFHYMEIHRLEDALPLPEVDQMTWQSIDTAPRDGTEILASDYDAIEIVSWVGPRFDVKIIGEWTNREGEAMYPAWWQPLPDHPSLPRQEVDG